ncbi:hypothetical protein V6N13_051805 [Hibiscus sabdariffa]|uniref:Uncharacterized protein n=1 Tax=Hibiscus sabdariffa TaxID=183260 RepID=A0ABR2T4I7_9ROSI
MKQCAAPVKILCCSGTKFFRGFQELYLENIKGTFGKAEDKDKDGQALTAPGSGAKLQNLSLKINSQLAKGQICMLEDHHPGLKSNSCKRQARQSYERSQAKSPTW